MLPNHNYTTGLAKLRAKLQAPHADAKYIVMLEVDLHPWRSVAHDLLSRAGALRHDKLYYQLCADYEGAPIPAARLATEFARLYAKERLNT